LKKEHCVAVTPIVRPLGPWAAAYLQLPGGWFLNNAGWLSGTEATLLIDTCATEARTRDLLAALYTHTPPEQRPLTVALTHAHGDHAHGAGLISRLGGTVVCRPTAATTIAAGPHTYPELFDYTDWGDITPPSDVQTITARTALDLGPSRIAEIVPVPNTAHTDGDLVVWIPHEGVLFPGDLVFTEVTPLAAHGSITGWLAALDWLADFEAIHIVPGHGAMGTGPTRGLIAPSSTISIGCSTLFTTTTPTSPPCTTTPAPVGTAGSTRNGMRPTSASRTRKSTATAATGPPLWPP
jgi:cyclase